MNLTQPATEAPAGADDQPQTLVWSRRAKPGCQDALEDVIERIGREMKRAHGFQAVAIMRPEPGHPPIFTMVAHFASAADVNAWTSSEVRGRLLLEAEEVSVGGLHTQQAAGLEAWFKLPGQPIVVPPPRYKMAVVTWLGLLPLLVGANLLAPLALRPLAPMLRVVPISLVLIALMTWVVMPVMTKWFRFWLYSSRSIRTP